MRAFAYSRPSTLSDILDRLADDPEARPLAGGMTLLPTLKQRLSAPNELVDLAGVPLLADIEEDEGELEVGATATHASVAASPVVRRLLPGLAGLARQIGDAQVRNRGTIGGSVANNDPAADYPAALLALGAKVVTDRREIPAADFFRGLFDTALAPGELVLSVRFPLEQRCAYAKFRHPVSGYALAGVCIAGRPGDWRVAVTGAGAGVFRLTALETRLAAGLDASAAELVDVEPSSLISDFHASGEYRAQLVRVMAARAISELAS